LPAATHCEIDGAGHAVHLEHSNRVADLIRDFRNPGGRRLEAAVRA
jgi:pimeloyl-ACP methyl ester carboxylesterase